MEDDLFPNRGIDPGQILLGQLDKQLDKHLRLLAGD
jgi:hypothetical protein